MTTIEFFSLWEIDKRDKQFNYSMGRMGQKTRYKFQIKDFKKSTKLTDLKIELSDDSMIR